MLLHSTSEDGQYEGYPIIQQSHADTHQPVNNISASQCR